MVWSWSISIITVTCYLGHKEGKKDKHLHSRLCSVDIQDWQMTRTEAEVCTAKEINLVVVASCTFTWSIPWEKQQRAVGKPHEAFVWPICHLQPLTPVGDYVTCNGHFCAKLKNQATRINTTCWPLAWSTKRFFTLVSSLSSLPAIIMDFLPVPSHPAGIASSSL